MTNDNVKSAIQATFFDQEDEIYDDVVFDEAAFDLQDLLGYEETPLLLVDTDPERAVARQKEMMDYCFGGIGEERKEEKRMGLAIQQLDIENRHALLVLLTHEEPEALIAHLRRCLADRDYGYGERGCNGRTVAQAMAALTGDDDWAGVATTWLAAHQEFRQRVANGQPFSFRSLFDYADIDSFAPVVQRVGDMQWQLGTEGEGKSRVFQGAFGDIWPALCDTYVEWSEADNQTWLERLQQQAARQPDSILRTARAERLRKEIDRLEVKGNQVILTTERGGRGWPRSLIYGDQIGLSRLSGHSFYELVWEGGLHVRRFELSSTTRNRIPVEHIELATALAETLALEYNIPLPPVIAEEVEAAYLRRMKAKRAEPGSPQPRELPQAIQGKPMVEYRVNNIVATLLHGGADFAYIAPVSVSANSDQEKEKTAVLLQRNEQKGVMVALPVVQGRPRRGSPLMTTPLAELDLKNGSWLRALTSWGAWLVSVLLSKDNKVVN
jgi:hypothetical protein